jgi:hypothetical protein
MKRNRYDESFKSETVNLALSGGLNRSKAVLTHVTEQFLFKNGSEIVDITQ